MKININYDNYESVIKHVDGYHEYVFVLKI